MLNVLNSGGTFQTRAVRVETALSPASMSTPAARYVRGSIRLLRLEQPELGARLGRHADTVVAGEARVTEMRGVGAGRFQHAFQREVAEAIGAHVAADLLDAVAGADQLLPRRRVDAVVTGPLDRG